MHVFSAARSTHPASKPALDSIRPYLQAFEPALGYPRGAELFPEGAPARSVYVLTSGIVRLQRASGESRVATVALRTEGSIPGVIAALMDTPYGMTATTVTHCEAYRFSSHAFRDLVQNEPAVSWYVHQLQAFETHEALERIAGLSCLSAGERLTAFLEDIAEVLPSSTEPGEVPLRDRELAQLLSVTPSYLSRLLKQLIREGRLRRVRGALFLTVQVASTR